MSNSRSQRTKKIARARTASDYTNSSSKGVGGKIHRFQEETGAITDLLSLETGPVAARFSTHADKSADSARKLSVCDALNIVRRENVVLSISKENCSCFGGRHFIGLEIIPLETFAKLLASGGHKVYKSSEIAYSSLCKQPQPVKRGDYLILGPLEKFEADPDVVLLFVNPAQAERMLGLISLKGVEPFMYYPASNICSTLTNVLAKGKPEINLVATFERKVAKWSPNEMILAMPLEDFESAVESIPDSGYGTFGADQNSHGKA
jgi:uncharacterized protein (DUF169 family)